MVVDLIRSRAALEAEIWTLRQQINILRRTVPKKFVFSAIDRLIFVGLYRLFPKICDALAIVKPDTIVRWHRAGFRSYWRWKSRPRGGRPTVPLEIRGLIREMSIANPLWGAPRIHGELLKLGIEVGQTSVAKYMARRRRPPSQGWKTFLHNHADGIAAMDLFVVPTISFRLLYGLLIVGHGRRQILWFGVTAHPTAEWIANQLTEACGWEQAPRYLIRDRDRAYGEVFIRRLRSMGIRDRPTSPRSPWQNGYAERLIGSIRRECLDHVVVFGERHLRHVLQSDIGGARNPSNSSSLSLATPVRVTMGVTDQEGQARFPSGRLFRYPPAEITHQWGSLAAWRVVQGSDAGLREVEPVRVLISRIVSLEMDAARSGHRGKKKAAAQSWSATANSRAYFSLYVPG
jgi:transposase InsO family protein